MSAAPQGHSTNAQLNIFELCVHVCVRACVRARVSVCVCVCFLPGASMAAHHQLQAMCSLVNVIVCACACVRARVSVCVYVSYQGHQSHHQWLQQHKPAPRTAGRS